MEEGIAFNEQKMRERERERERIEKTYNQISSKCHVLFSISLMLCTTKTT